MNQFLAITFVIVVSSCYGDALWSGTNLDWAGGMTPCQVCQFMAEAEVSDLTKARDALIPGFSEPGRPTLPGLMEQCGKYPTPEGSCDAYVKVFNDSFNLLIERQNKTKELCAYYTLCESSSTLDISFPTLPVAPVTPKQIPSKVYDDAVCNQCTNTVAAMTFMGIGNYASRFATRTKNVCLEWVKTTEFPSDQDIEKCSQLNSVYFNPITDNIVDKSTQNYLCWDLFDVCEPSKKPSELKLPKNLKEITKNLPIN
ncbi:uncharacterized protein LOC128389370 [Panonychus citri]|uniref:uncharacterized protein LOC128389370 n=1 Tax=Panonychus citri TaxID=50023 RepID=UPI002308175A|nr:uncharacterized protein LOC128389370 [Panonychus citri]